MSPERAVPLHADTRFLAQPSGDLVLDPAGKVPAWRIVHFRRPAQSAHRCLHRVLQSERKTVRLDQSQSSPTPGQRPPYQRTVIPGTRFAEYVVTEDEN